MASEEESSRKKRGAENQLTQHNWEADDDPIDPQVSVCPCRPLAGLCAVRGGEEVVQARFCRRQARIGVVMWSDLHSKRGPSRRQRRTSSRSEESSRREEAAQVTAPGGISSCVGVFRSCWGPVVWAGGWCVGRSLGALQASLFLAVWTHVSLTRRAAQCGPRDHTARKRLAIICCSYAKVLC
jgi:hypothetical protein